MNLKLWCLILSYCFLVNEICGHTMMYRVNENRHLEPAFVPVSSTVVPLPIYKVGYGIITSSGKDQKVKPKGPVQLITVKNYKDRKEENGKERNIKENITSI